MQKLWVCSDASIHCKKPNTKNNALNNRLRRSLQENETKSISPVNPEAKSGSERRRERMLVLLLGERVEFSHMGLDMGMRVRGCMGRRVDGVRFNI
jgi:hypothetical protein